MQVILMQKVRNLGDLGDQVKVRSGYGRNYLVPQGIALPATPENVRVFEERRSELMAASQERIDRAQGRAEKLNGISITIPMRASDEGKLYGSVGPQEIAGAASEDGHELEAHEVVLPDGQIRSVGRFPAVLQLHPEVEAEIEVVVAQLTDLGVNMPPERSAAADEAEEAAEAAEAAEPADAEDESPVAEEGEADAEPDTE